MQNESRRGVAWGSSQEVPPGHRHDELQLLHAIGLAVVATDTEGTFTFVNESVTETYASDAEELAGRQVLELLRSDADAASPFDLDKVLIGESWRGT